MEEKVEVKERESGDLEAQVGELEGKLQLYFLVTYLSRMKPISTIIQWSHTLFLYISMMFVLVRLSCFLAYVQN